MAPLKSNATDEAGFKRLVELETEYRTQRSPDQLYAIASFPHLFDEFPYPVIINAGILKLADYFRQSNNIQRHAILQVFKKSQPHLKKVINVEETIKRISPMLQSNDPLARAITLRVLGGMATIVSDRIDVYHNVIHSLDSSEAMEVSAAVYAADMICAQSQRFCAIISGKLAYMVRDTVKTPLPLRRRLIRIFGHMFEDITLARLARKTCMDILELNQDGEYTVAILRTLTKLASHSLVDVNQQIDLLLQRAKKSSNQDLGIRRVSLICLGLLAQKNIDFNRDQIQAIFDIALEFNDEKTTLKAVLTLRKIFRLTVTLTSISLLDSGTEIIKGYIQTCIKILDRSFSTLSSATSSQAAMWSKLVVLECYAVLAIILPHYQQLEGTGLGEATDSTFNAAAGKVTQSMELFLERIFSRQGKLSKDDAAQARMVLSSLVSLTLDGGSSIDSLITTLLEWINTTNVDSSTLLAKALLHIARQQPRKLSSFQDKLVVCLENCIDAPDTRTFILLFRTLLEVSALDRSSGSATKTSFEARITAILEKFGGIDMLERYTKNRWDLYQLAQYSLQTGWSSLALVALKNQDKQVTGVSSSHWLTTIQTVALTESSLQAAAGREGQKDHGQLNLCSQKQMYTKVLSYLEELEAHQVNRSFHIRYSSLRRQYLDGCQSTIGVLQLLFISIGNNHSKQQELQCRWSTTDEIALSRCADKFNSLAHQYTLLRAVITSTPTSSELNSQGNKVDQHSDGAIEVLQTMCLIIAYVIQRVVKVLEHTSRSAEKSKDSSSMDTDVADTDVFDVDPLLIPLLYLQSQYQERQQEMERDGNSTPGPRTHLEIFKMSTALTLGYIDENLIGSDIGAIEKGISILKQIIFGYISYSIPIPQEFFVSIRQTPQEQADY
ncbi:Integrator complex subunit 7 [Entomortierella beljakovae]|nr:Integrator complex subunit 7 [Entomortierella beljakovae]